MFAWVALVLLFASENAASSFFDESITKESTAPDSDKVCVPEPKGGVAWILSVRRPDFGWRENTHRAVMALAVNHWGTASIEEIRQMELQLEVELTKDLLRNTTSPMHSSDLALYVQSLIATRRNPQAFYGLDLVSQLERFMVAADHRTHPFLLLALCNADRLSDRNMQRLTAALRALKKDGSTESLALALKAYACASSRGNEVDEALISEVEEKLKNLQHADGSFGNVYTTALVVQALGSTDWPDKKSALKFLEKMSTIDVNMVSTYLIQLALNAEKINFIKDLHPDLILGSAVHVNKQQDPFVQYSLRVGNPGDVYFTITIRKSPEESFFDVMKRSAQHDPKFNFSYYMNNDDKPAVYSISGVPNDVDENMYWRLCLQYDVNHNRHDSKIKTINYSPIDLHPEREQHVIYWYRDTDCEVS